MKYSVACCLMSHNHPDTVDEILGKSINTYAEHGIDILVYDDSNAQNDTRKIVEKYIASGANNLYYIDAHVAKHGDNKYMLVMQGYGLPKNYDYIWPCKDRTCFEGTFLDKLCNAIDEGHDVILATNEGMRWDVGINVFKDVYTDPAEFYRLYCAASTNWEDLIRKKETMLDSIDWTEYDKIYNSRDNTNFNQTISLFLRLAEMNSCSIRICRFEFNERYISQTTFSNWGADIFKVWIDRWVAINFELPPIYDKYKAEAIKSETNLSELFGSVEQMIRFKEAGMYSREIFEKYLNTWSFVTNIPINVLEMIADGDYNNAISYTIADFENSFSIQDYRKAWWIIAANTWFKDYYDATTYGLLVMCFNKYRENMQHVGASAVFDGVSSIDDLKKKYGVIGS